MDTLFSLISRIKTCFGVQICVHDVTGVTYSRSSLNLPYLWMQHGCEYCSVAKRCVSEKRCKNYHRRALVLARYFKLKLITDGNEGKLGRNAYIRLEYPSVTLYSDVIAAVAVLDSGGYSADGALYRFGNRL